jgi:hypothetical protein
MGIYKLSGAGSVAIPRTQYRTMNAGNQYGAMVPIGYIKTTTVGQSVFFSNIPQNYQDLMVVVVAGTASVGVNAYPYDLVITYNADNGPTNYSYTRLSGNGSSASSDRGTSYAVIGKLAGNTGTTTTYATANTVHVLNYSNTTTYKTAIGRWANEQNTGDTNGTVGLNVDLWQSTAAITSLTIQATLISGSTIALYGIRAVSS